MDSHQRIIPERASGYEQQSNRELCNATYIDMSAPYAAGALYSTVEDMLIWHNALSNNSLISPALTEIMFTSAKGDCACGWFVKKVNERIVASHPGGTSGFASNIERVEAENYCSVILSNVRGTPISTMAKAIHAIVFGRDYHIPRRFTAIELDESLLDNFVGSYETGPGMYVTVAPEIIVDIFRKGPSLLAQIGSEVPAQLRPYAEDKFFFEDQYAQATFTRNARSEVIGLILHENGADHLCRKTDSE